ncbi:hypothetical protein JXA56_05055 [Candidatus Micrarchaeota archaeon]|nr:hypothetical protein [Candidatus Micrarchaeota archaeon]
MTDLRRSIKCSGCGNESTVYIQSQFDLRDFLLSGKCSCGNSLQINFNVIEKEAAKEMRQAEPPSSNYSFDDSIFGTPSETPRNTLQDIMEE